MPTILGIVTGIQAEADLLRRVTRTGGTTARPLIEVAGLGEGRAAQAAERLIARGATHLMSFGIAGGLDPTAGAGTVIVAAEVRGLATVRGDAGWAARLAAFLTLAPAPLAHAADVVTTPAAKARLFVQTGAIAADMESYGVAEVAVARGLPFVALRAVGDTAADIIPPLALAAITPEGRVKPLAAILGALTQPTQIPGLIRLGRQTSIAMQALEISAGLAAARGFLAGEA